MNISNPVFSNADISYIFSLPEVLESKHLLYIHNKIDFKIPLTESIRSSLQDAFGIELAGVSNLPMRWIKGDTLEHNDFGISSFNKTYLVYLNDSSGNFIVDSTPYPIIENTGYSFNEGLLHSTENTGVLPRLLLGPMDENANPVGIAVAYYTNYADAFASNGNYIATGGYVIGSEINYGSIGNYSMWRVAKTSNVSVPTGTYTNGFDLSTFGYSNYFLYPSSPCFLEGTKILCKIDNVDTYVPIEKITPETLVKTSRDGYKKVVMIGKKDFINRGDDERVENRIYKCSPEKYHNLTEDLYITGSHSILVDSLTETQRKNTMDNLGDIFITDRKYRLMAYIDERAEPWKTEGTYTVWHFALENTDYYMNYGVYANGTLLVESCSKRYMKELSNLTYIE